MSDPVEFLDLDDVVDLAIRLLGDPAPIPDIGLLGSAVARPQTTAFGEEAYPDIWTKAAALLHSIIENHVLVDGNERLGWLAAAVFLEINGVEISRASNDGVYDLVIDVTAGQPTVDAIAERLRQIATSHTRTESAANSTSPRVPVSCSSASVGCAREGVRRKVAGSVTTGTGCRSPG